MPLSRNLKAGVIIGALAGRVTVSLQRPLLTLQSPLTSGPLTIGRFDENTSGTGSEK